MSQGVPEHAMLRRFCRCGHQLRRQHRVRSQVPEEVRGQVGRPADLGVHCIELACSGILVLGVTYGTDTVSSDTCFIALLRLSQHVAVSEEAWVSWAPAAGG